MHIVVTAGKLKFSIVGCIRSGEGHSYIVAIVLLKLQNPRNDDDNGDEKEDDDAGNADDNDEDYQYGGKKEANRRADDGRLDCTTIWSLVR